MTRFAWTCLFLLPLQAHTISMSHGIVTVHGSSALYQLRMPAYELVHLSNPEQALLAEIHFFSGGVEGRIVERSCREDASLGALICDAVYRFPADIDTLQVVCRFARVTVPNHIHLLRAIKGQHADRAIFDRTVETADLRFRPPTRFETAIRDIIAGMRRAATSVPGLIFLVALAFAGRSSREFVHVLLAFFAGQAISSAVLPHVRLDPAPRFIEIAMLLTIAYLLVEIVFLPRGSGRWLVAGVLGLFHGMYYYLLVRDGDFKAAYVLAGAFLVGSAASTLVFLLRRAVAGKVRPAASPRSG